MEIVTFIAKVFMQDAFSDATLPNFSPAPRVYWLVQPGAGVFEQLGY